MGVLIAEILALIFVGFIWLYPPLQIRKEQRAPAPIRKRWAILSILGGPTLLLAIAAIFHVNPELAVYLKSHSQLDKLAGVFVGMGFALPYLTLVAYRLVWRQRPNLLVKRDAPQASRPLP